MTDLGQERPPLGAVVKVDVQAELDAGRLPWPLFRMVEAPACGATIYFPEGATKDRIARQFWCDIESSIDHDHHRAVYDLGEGRVFTWADGPTVWSADGPFQRS